MTITNFTKVKKEILEQYKSAIRNGLVDEEIKPINEVINQFEGWVTTSSCMGRIVVISKEHLRSKYQTTFHHKSHDPSNNLPDFINLDFHGELWFLTEAPNLHVRCNSLDNAIKLVNKALTAKLGRTKYQSIFPNIVVEILGTSSLQTPLGVDGELMVPYKYLEHLWSKACEILITEQRRLRDLVLILGK